MQKIVLCHPAINAVDFQGARVPGRLPFNRKSPPVWRFTKTLLVMKLTFLLLIAGMLSARAEGFSQTITFAGKNVKLTQVFSAIEKQTGYTFFANKGLLKEAGPVTVTASNMPLESFLNLVFEKQPISYEINNKTIFLKVKTDQPVDLNPTADQSISNKPPAIDLHGVIRTDEGQPLAGATVAIKGANKSVVTDAEGKFSISAEADQTLVITFIGYKTVEEKINSRTEINVVLEKSVVEVEQVVVTALGITRKSKALTYNVQEIKGDEVNRVKDANFVNTLNGKVAGATINSSASGTGGSSRVILRGVKSIMNNNNALYVIDGIPMPNNVRNQPDDIYSGAGQTGDFVSNINPEDIENISVLSGPSAAALYGSAAANGVIIVTTKKGRKDRTDISVGNSTMFTSPLLLPKFQHTYGQSETGSYYSWGEELVTPSTYKPEDFFETGFNTTSTLTFSTGTDRNQTYISLGNVRAEGIIPNNEYSRSNFTLRNTTSFLENKMSLDVGFMAGLVDEQNMISQGQYFNPLVAAYLFPPGDDFNRVRAYERYNSSRNLMAQFWPYGDNGLMMQNPFWVTQRDLFENKKERYIANAALRYNLKSWLNLSGRVKLDKNNEKSEKKFAATTNTLFASENGYYSLNTINDRQIYADVLANANKTFGTDYSLIVNAGASIEDVRSDQYLYGGKLQGVANLYTYTNIINSTADISQTGYRKQKQSVFGNAQFGYQNKLFLDVSARNDWASTLAGSNNNSFFYPSVGVSAVMTDLLPIKSNTLSYLKLRASYAEVGNEPSPNLTIPTYPLAGGFPVTQTRMPNPDLKPELTKSFELGLNVALLKGALTIDATAYSSRTYNQFFEPTLSSASGYTSVIVNAGRVDNKGIEVSARYTHMFGDVKWSTNAIYSLNNNKIVQLLDAWENPVTGEIISLQKLDMSGTGSYKMTLTEGGSMGDIYVNTLRVDEHGAIYVDPGSQTVVAEPNIFVFAGNSNPKYNLGWGNEFSWKGISLNFLFTGRVGGIVVSNTQAIMDAFGVSQASADARDNGGALVNGKPIPAKEYYSVVGAGASGGIASMYCYSATNVRLGELAVGYELPVKKWTRFIKSANVSLIGRNLFFLYNSAPFDPELTANTQTYFQGIDYFMMPSLRSMGFSVKLNF